MHHPAIMSLLVLLPVPVPVEANKIIPLKPSLHLVELASPSLNTINSVRPASVTFRMEADYRLREEPWNRRSAVSGSHLGNTQAHRTQVQLPVYD